PGRVRLPGSKFLIVGLDGHLDPPPRARDRADGAAPELAGPHPLTGRIARRVLRGLDIPVDLNRRRAPRRRPAPRAAPGTIPLWRGAPLLDCARRQRVEEARRLRQLAPPRPVSRARP